MSAYIPPHKRHSQNATHDNSSGTKVMFFGDSFVRLFGLVNDSSITVKAFSGASAQELANSLHKVRLSIECLVRSNASTVDRWIFCFGGFDLNLSYYGKKFKYPETNFPKNENDSWDLENIAKAYVDFVASLPFGEQSTATVLGLYPSPLEDKHVAKSLVHYNQIHETTKDMVMRSEDVKLHNRQERIRSFNRALELHCLTHGLGYSDVFDRMIDAETDKIHEIYRDVKDTNIHVVWETTILLWLEKWPWLKELAPPATKLNRSLSKYSSRNTYTKPLAEW